MKKYKTVFFKEMLKKEGLNKEESSISLLICTGYSNIEISKKMDISKYEVETFILSIYKKLRVKSRGQLISFCLPFLICLGPVKTPKKNMG